MLFRSADGETTSPAGDGPLGSALTVFIAVAAGVVLVWLLVMVAVIRRMLYIAQPNEVLVLSGVRRIDAAGRILTYRTIRGGRVIRMPLLNRIDRLDLTVMNVELAGDGALARGFVPCVVQGIAQVRIADQEPEVDNAVRRLMGLRREEIAELARELLHGALRRVLAAVTHEDAAVDRERFEAQLSHEVESQLSRQGLVLSGIRIQSIEVRPGRAEALPRLGGLGAPKPGPRHTT